MDRTRWLLTCLLVLTAITGCFHTRGVRDTFGFKVSAVEAHGGVVLVLSGLPCGSANYVDEIETDAREDVLTVSVKCRFVGLYLTTDPYRSGTLWHAIAVPRKINEIRFGSDDVPIWRRAQGVLIDSPSFTFHP